MNFQEGISVWEYEWKMEHRISFPVVDISYVHYHRLIRDVGKDVEVWLGEEDVNLYVYLLPQWVTAILQVVFCMTGLFGMVALCYKLRVLNRSGLKYQRNLKLIIIGVLFMSNLANMTKSSVDPFLSNGSLYYVPCMLLSAFSLWGISVSTGLLAMLWDKFLKEPKSVQSGEFKKSLGVLFMLNCVLFGLDLVLMFILVFQNRYLLLYGFGFLYLLVLGNTIYFGVMLVRLCVKFRKVKNRMNRLNPMKKVQYPIMFFSFVIIEMTGIIFMISGSVVLFYIKQFFEIVMTYLIIFCTVLSIRESKNYTVQIKRFKKNQETYENEIYRDESEEFSSENK